MTPEARRKLVLDLALRLRERVLPELGAFAGRAHSGDGAGGDITFAVDAVAEAALEEFLAERAPELAYYSEDRGLVASAEASEVLVVDPIDGTRPAMAGLESACVAVALAPLGDGEPTMGAISTGCVVEIKSGQWFLAGRDQGVEMSSGAPRLSPNRDLTRMFWSYGFRGRPARPTVEVLGDLIDGSSVGWRAPSSSGSQAFSMTRIVTGQLDAVSRSGRGWSTRSRGCAPSSSGSAAARSSTTPPMTWPRRGCACARRAGVISDGWGRHSMTAGCSGPDTSSRCRRSRPPTRPSTGPGGRG